MARIPPQTDEYGNPSNQAGTPQPIGGSDEQVRAAFLKYLGHPNTSNIWQNDPNYEQNIANSPEGQAYAASQQQQNPSAPAAGAPAPPAASTTPGYNYAQAQASWFNAPPGTTIDQWVKDNPQFTQGITSSHNGEYMNLPGGQSFDAQRNFGAGQSTQWGDKQHDYATGRLLSQAESDAAEAQWASEHGGGGGGGYTGSVSGTINGATSGATDPMGAAVQAAILKQISGLQTATDANSSTVKDITDPYHLQSQRGLEATRRALAEQAYASGNLNTGGYGQSQISAVEHAGADEANFVGQTVATQEAQRQAMLMSMLGLGQNASQFSTQLSATQKNFADQLSQQDRQFAATLAQNVAQFGQSMGYQYALLDWSKTQKGIDSSSAPV